MLKHVEITAPELLNGLTASTKQMHRSSALKVEIAICTSIKSSFLVRLQAFQE